jgi:hypothetical protein
VKLKYFLNTKGKKEYTLKENSKTKDAHYKFVKIKNAPKSK